MCEKSLKSLFIETNASALDAVKNKIKEYYGYFEAIYNAVKSSDEFEIVSVTRDDEHMNLVFYFKGHINYRCFVEFTLTSDNIRSRLFYDEDGFKMEKAEEDLEHLKYFYFGPRDLYPNETPEEQVQRYLNFYRETIEENEEYLHRINVDHVMSADVFTTLVQSQMNPTGHYLFDMPATSEQSNYWYFEKLKEKIKKHPHIWKWFFTV